FERQRDDPLGFCFRLSAGRAAVVSTIRTGCITATSRGIAATALFALCGLLTVTVSISLFVDMPSILVASVLAGVHTIFSVTHICTIVLHITIHYLSAFPFVIVSLSIFLVSSRRAGCMCTTPLCFFSLGGFFLLGAADRALRRVVVQADRPTPRLECTVGLNL